VISFAAAAAGKLAYRLKKSGEKVRFCLLLLQCDRCLYKERVLGY
jgi:hypothetical protein